MGNVVEFPTNSVAESALRGSLESQVHRLEEMYEKLDALHAEMHDMEKDCNQLEFEFDYNLSKYAKRVGAENVEVEFLGYTSRHIVSVDADGGSLTLTIDEGVLDED